MYRPTQDQRMFSFHQKYSDINWNDFHMVADAFREKLEYWYILPGMELKENQHFGFAIAALASLLIDCLSQYEDGITAGKPDNFKNYLRRHWPTLATQYPTSINTQRNGNPFQVRDGADAIYHGLRCGVLHEAHVKLYVGLTRQAEIATYHRTGYATYLNGADCPVVTIDPVRLFNAVHQRFNAYIGELHNNNTAYDQTRNNFKTAFEAGYGVTISTII